MKISFLARPARRGVQVLAGSFRNPSAPSWLLASADATEAGPGHCGVLRGSDTRSKRPAWDGGRLSGWLPRDAVVVKRLAYSIDSTNHNM